MDGNEPSTIGGIDQSRDDINRDRGEAEGPADRGELGDAFQTAGGTDRFHVL